MFKHIGSGNSDDQVAIEIDCRGFNQSGFSITLEREPKFHNLLSVENAIFGTYYSFFYEVIADLMTQIGLDKNP